MACWRKFSLVCGSIVFQAFLPFANTWFPTVVSFVVSLSACIKCSRFVDSLNQNMSHLWQHMLWEPMVGQTPYHKPEMVRIADVGGAKCFKVSGRDVETSIWKVGLGKDVLGHALEKTTIRKKLLNMITAERKNLALKRDRNWFMNFSIADARFALPRVCHNQ